jgi:hypothetical protein
MKKCILRCVGFAASAGLVLAAHAQDTTDQSQFPTILQQPVDQCVPIGAPVTFSVVASNVDSYQWYGNNGALDGQTNSSLTIPSAGIGDVGYYYASVIKGAEAVPTRSAGLNVYLVSTLTTTTSSGPKTRFASSSLSVGAADLGSGGVITVFGSPVVSAGGSGTCPGKYAGYVNFTKPPSQGWGWSPSISTTTYTATDTNRSDTRIQFGGDFGDIGCAQTAVTIPFPAMSPVYRFSIYFPPGTAVPTNAYPITLNGFNP